MSIDLEEISLSMQLFKEIKKDNQVIVLEFNTEPDVWCRLSIIFNLCWLDICLNRIPFSDSFWLAAASNTMSHKYWVPIIATWLSAGGSFSFELHSFEGVFRLTFA